MGYTANSYAVFGHKTTRSALTITQKLRGCEHTIKEQQNFCPKCGEPAWVMEKKFIADEELNEKVKFFCPFINGEEGVLGVSLATTSDNEIKVINEPSSSQIDDIIAFYEKHNIELNKSKLNKYVMVG